VFVHGGAFMQGDRGDYAVVGEQLARQGLATAVVSYRNFPQADASGATADVAAAVAFLCSPDGAYITGETLHVNGGMYMA
jgi:acetyl esterase/lipase